MRKHLQARSYATYQASNGAAIGARSSFVLIVRAFMRYYALLAAALARAIADASAMRKRHS